MTEPALLALHVTDASSFQAVIDTAKRCDVLLMPRQLLERRWGAGEGGPSWEDMLAILRSGHTTIGLLESGDLAATLYPPIEMSREQHAAWSTPPGYPASVALAIERSLQRQVKLTNGLQRLHLDARQN